MIFQLPNGKSIEMSIEQYLNMTDEDLNSFVAFNWGEELNDPFTRSVLQDRSFYSVKEELEIIGYESLSKEDLEDLENIILDTSISDEEFDCEDPD